MKKALFLILLSFTNVFGAEISFTVDDPETSESPAMTPHERNQRILDAFDQFHLKGALFVCGMRINDSAGRKLLLSWNERGHLLGNHSYSHLNYNSEAISPDAYLKDLLKAEPLINHFINFKKFYRFPFLKEGSTPKKRDWMRAQLKEKGYRNGHVSIDASDWYVDFRLRERLKMNPRADVQPFKDYYLDHMWNRAQFYDGLAKKLYNREIKHTLLIHHNLLNALFLTELLQMFKDKGWKLISPEEAYQDPIYDKEPNIMPAGESILWALAKKTGRYEDALRYPGEDGDYERNEMDQLGL